MADSHAIHPAPAPATPSSQPVDALPLADAYRIFEVGHRVRQAKLCAGMALVIMLLCLGMDAFVYPKLLHAFIVARGLFDVALIPCFLALFTRRGRRCVNLIGHVPPAIGTLTICWMIYAADGVASPYYAGLNFIMMGVILLIPYTLKEAASICTFVVLAYVVTCVLHHARTTGGFTSARLWWAPDGVGGTPARSLLTNLYFMVITASIALASCHYGAVRRFKEFSLRHELDINNHNLATTLDRLKSTEVQLVQSEKMNALGKLSAGLLHEVNNPLNFTFMALEAAQGDAVDDTMKETLADIHQGMSRIRSVISDLRGFAYPTQLSGAEAFSLDDVMSTAQRLTAHELNDITVRRDGIKGFIARGSKDQIVHVFMNLLVNSAHASKSKEIGRPATIDVTCERRGKLLAVTVRDNGTGVKTEHLPKLFEPFFTTKEKGKGTGLGLSICQTIIENHGGKITAASEAGQWTAVTFELPASQEQLAAAA